MVDKDLTDVGRNREIKYQEMILYGAHRLTTEHHRPKNTSTSHLAHLALVV